MLSGLSKGVPCPPFSSMGSTTPHSPHWDRVLAGSEMPQSPGCKGGFFRQDWGPAG